MNKAQVEGSISIRYIMDEVAKFASFYLKEGDPSGDGYVLLVASSEMDTSGDVDVDEHLIDHEEETNDEEEFKNDVTTSEEEDEPDLDDSDENE